jgi:RNA polymerase sigma-70 factor, ECF subfamily
VFSEEQTVSDAEAQWIVQAQAGDDGAFARLVESYQRPVYNLCYRMLGDSYEAEDAAQEAFLRAYRAIRRYDNNRPFATWLLSIASHYCIDQIRRRRMQVVSMEALPGETIPDKGIGPEAAMRIGEDQKQVQDLLASLAPADRSAVILYYWYEYSYEEIADTLSLSVSAVKSRLHRARKALAETWQNKQLQTTIPQKRKRYESPAY